MNVIILIFLNNFIKGLEFTQSLKHTFFKICYNFFKETCFEKYQIIIINLFINTFFIIIYVRCKIQISRK